MTNSKFISLLAWSSAIVLVWAIILGRVEYNGLALGAFIFFVVVGIGAGLLSISDTVRK